MHSQEKVVSCFYFATRYSFYLVILRNQVDIVEKSVIQKLTTVFNPIHLKIANESAHHATPDDAESHFKILIVSDAFVGKSLVQQHKLVYAQLRDEISSGKVHAVSIESHSPESWRACQEIATLKKSPACRGGDKKNG